MKTYLNKTLDQWTALYELVNEESRMTRNSVVSLTDTDYYENQIACMIEDEDRFVSDREWSDIAIITRHMKATALVTPKSVLKILRNIIKTADEGMRRDRSMDGSGDCGDMISRGWSRWTFRKINDIVALTGYSIEYLCDVAKRYANKEHEVIPGPYEHTTYGELLMVLSGFDKEYAVY